MLCVQKAAAWANYVSETDEERSSAKESNFLIFKLRAKSRVGHPGGTPLPKPPTDFNQVFSKVFYDNKNGGRDFLQCD